MQKLKIKKDDIVMVIAGADKGTTGKVQKVFPKAMRVLVEGVNIRKKHAKPDQQNQQGGIIEKTMPVHYSNVQLLDSNKKTTRIGVNIVKNSDGSVSKNRIARSNGKQI